MDKLSTYFGLNPILLAGMGMALWGWALYLARAVPLKAWQLAKRRFTMQVEVANTDDAFYWLERWLAEHPYSKQASALEVVARPLRSRRTGASVLEVGHTEERPTIFLTPAPGHHILKFGGKWLYLTRGRPNGPAASHESDAAEGFFRHEQFTINMISRDQQLVRELLEAARDLALPPNEPKLQVHCVNQHWWEMSRSSSLRPAESLVLRRGLLEEVVRDATEFSNSREWYRLRGVPYRRGYLLHGPPGNGKTSLVHVVASVLRRDVYVCNLSSMKDDTLNALLAQVPEKSIVLIEDVDCAGLQRAHAQDAPLTLSGLLNALDGMTSSEGRITFMTTNKPEVLDEALTRPGRVDFSAELVNADEDMAQRLFLRFFPGEVGLAELFAEQWSGRSMAALQAQLLSHKDDAPAAATRNGQHPSVGASDPARLSVPDERTPHPHTRIRDGEVTSLVD